MSALDSYQNLFKEPSVYRDLMHRLRGEIEEDLHASLSIHDPTVPNLVDWQQAILYPIEAGGKRVRPLLVRLLAGALVGESAELDIRPAATALELVHTYSLVHDDLPAMDNDDFRRGKPTLHKKFGESTAILVGDSLLTEAFGVLSQAAQPDWIGPWVRILSQASGARGMCLGQWLDLRHGSASDPVQELKTGKLFEACSLMPLAMGRFAESEWQHWSHWGLELGTVFQAVDDLHDNEIEPSKRDQLKKTIESRTQALGNAVPGASIYALAIRALVAALATRSV